MQPRSHQSQERSVRERGRPGDRRRQLALVVGALAGIACLGAGGVAALTSTPAAPARTPALPAASAAAAPAAAAPAPSPALVEQTVRPVRLYRARSDPFFSSAVLQRDPSTLSVVKDVGEGSSPREAAALLVVLPVPARPECLQEATLALDVAETLGSGAMVGIYPGAATSLVDGRLPASGESSAATLIDNRPRGVARVTSAGPVEVDVTALARTWTAGGPFPSTGRTIPRGTPLLLVLRPTDAAAGRWTMRLASPPRLTYRSTRDCGEP